MPEGDTANRSYSNTHNNTENTQRNGSKLLIRDPRWAMTRPGGLRPGDPSLVVSLPRVLNYVCPIYSSRDSRLQTNPTKIGDPLT